MIVHSTVCVSLWLPQSRNDSRQMFIEKILEVKRTMIIISSIMIGVVRADLTSGHFEVASTITMK